MRCLRDLCADVELPEVQWTPKALDMGAFIAAGSDRLLGRTGMSPTDVLVREMAQNAWDARACHQRPRFEMHLRSLSGEARRALRVFLGDAQGLGLEHLEGSAGVQVLEIADRGTTGLDGPFDLRPTAQGESSNYQDLILKLGVPRSDGGGGGTFGFGKTAAYAYSGCGTVIHWTRCRHEGRLQQRLIGSAMGDPFTDDRVQFTGRHWWGRREGNLVLPLLDEDAEAWGRVLFAGSFAGGDCGTSMLIIAPLVEQTIGDRDALRDPEEDVDAPDFATAARSAIRRNLWPKMTPASPDEEAPMEVRLTVEGSLVGLGTPQEGAWKHWAMALNAVRAQRSGRPLDEGKDGLLDIMEVTSYRRAVGDIALLRRPLILEQVDPDDDLDPAAPDAGINRLALMRGRAELVLGTREVKAGEPGSLWDWIAVFIAREEFEKEFASAEPPAHDDWIADGRDKDVDRLARVVKTKVPRQIQEALAVHVVEPVAGDQVSALHMARRLATILPATLPDTRPGRAQRPTRERRGRTVEILRHHLLPAQDASGQDHRVDFIVHSNNPTAGPIRLLAGIVSRDRDSGAQLNGEQLNPRWAGVVDVHEGGIVALARPGEHASLTFTCPRRRAVDVELIAEDTEEGTH